MDDPLRTLLISPYFDASTPSGGVLCSLDVAEEWLRRGRQVAVLCSSAPRSLGALQPWADAGQLTLHPIVSPAQIRFTHHVHPDVRRLAGQAIGLFRPDVIHVHNTQGMLGAVLAAAESPAPVVLTALDFGMLCFNFYLRDADGMHCAGRPVADCAGCISRDFHGPARYLGPILSRSLTRRIWPDFVRLDQVKLNADLRDAMSTILRSVNLVIAPSPVMAERMRDAAGPAVSVHEVLYGVSPRKMVRPPKVPSSVLRLAFMGGADAIKGFSTLAAALERLPDGLRLQLRVMGGPSIRRRVEEASGAARRYLLWRPALYGAELASAHADIDVLLVPSLWHENSPFVILEALANGTPVLASDQAGIRHLVEPGTDGWLVEPGNADAWAARIVALVEDGPALAAAQRHAAFTRTTRDFVDDLERLELPLVRERAASVEVPAF